MRLFYFTSGPRERVFDAVLAAGHEIAALYVTDPARWPKVVPTVQRAAARSIPVRVVSRRDLESPSDELRGAVCLSVGFGLIFPAGFLSAIGACLNVHGTLLPKYAGARTLNWVIACGERENGVTVHLVDAGVDTGPVLVQRGFSLSSYETGRSLARKTLDFEPPVVVEALSLLARHGVAAAMPQDAAGVTRFPDRRPEHSALDPSQPLSLLYDQIRAADAERYPAYFYVNGEKVCVRLWRPQKSDDEHDLV